VGENPDDGSYIIGDDCLICKAVLFGGANPKYAMASVSGIELCPDVLEGDPNGSFLLTQAALAPCVYRGVHGDYDYVWNITDGSGFAVNMLAPPARAAFASGTDDDCVDEFANQLLECTETDKGTGGEVTITWGNTIHP